MPHPPSEATNRLKEIEERLAEGTCVPADVSYLLNEVKRSHPTYLPSFDLGDPHAVQPDILRPTTHLDRFLLALALVFNDFKDIVTIIEWLKPHQPEEFQATGFYGQWAGLKNHVVRLATGMLHELCVLLAKHEQVIDSSEFRTLLSSTPAKTRNAWQGLLLLTKQGRLPANERSALRAALLLVRNKTAFHYDAKELAAGYDFHFASGDQSPGHQSAYLSMGPQMKHCRFYFADAAARGYEERLSRRRSMDLDQLVSDALEEMNLALGPIVMAHASMKTGGALPLLVDDARHQTRGQVAKARAGRPKLQEKSRRKNRKRLRTS